MKLACMLALSFVQGLSPEAFSGQCRSYEVKLESNVVLEQGRYKLERDLTRLNVYRNEFYGIDDPMANPLLERLLGF